MATKEDHLKALELELEEQRRDQDFVTAAYREYGIKNITFLAAALGLLGYLYGGVTADGVSLKQKLFIPDEPYGIIIYALSLGLFLCSIAALLTALKSRTWSTAYDDETQDGVTGDYETYLKYMIRRYNRSSRINSASYAKKQAAVQNSFIPLLLGGILLLLLKTFRG